MKSRDHSPGIGRSKALRQTDARPAPGGPGVPSRQDVEPWRDG